jgi:hypothetical protein
MRDDMEILQFSKIVQYLYNPLALIGFGLLLLFGIFWGILKSGLLSQLSQRQSDRILSQILRYGVSVSIALMLLGFLYAGLSHDNDANEDHNKQGLITQQAGDCGSNILGDNNQATIECRDQETKTK